MFARTKKGECALDLTITGGRLDLLKGFIAAGLNLGQLTQVNIAKRIFISSLVCILRKQDDFSNKRLFKTRWLLNI